MARRLAEALVSIEADTSLFRSEAMAGIKKALAGVEGKIPVTADTERARAQVAELKKRMTDLSRQLAQVKIGANGKPAEATLRKLQLQLKELADTVASVAIGADTSRLDLAIKKEEGNLARLSAQASHLTLDANEKKLAAKISAAEAGLERLNEQASGLVIDADDKRMLSKLADMEQRAFHLRAALGDPEAIRPEVDTAAMKAKLASLDADILVSQEHMTGMTMDADSRALLEKIYAAEAELRALRELGDIPLIADAVALDAAIAASMAKLEALRAEAADLKIGGKADLATLAAAENRLLGLEDAAKRLNPEIEATNRKLIQGARGFGRFGLGALAARVALFGGLRAVTGWHIALDTVIESLAVIVPALVTAAAGLAAFGIAGADAGRAVYNRLQNIHTVADALNQTIPPMTGHLEALHNVVRPQVWQLYGDAIAIAHSKTGLFEKLAVDTGGVIDKLAGRLTVLATTSGSGLSKFLASGARDLAQFGRIFLSLGDAFGKLIQVTEQTHIAEILLSIVGAAAKLFDIFTKIPLPILAAVVGFHGIYLWSGLAASAITALLRPLGRLAASAAGAKLAGTAVKELAAAGGGSRFARLGAAFRDLGTNIQVLPGRVKGLASTFLTFVKGNWPSILVAVGVAALVTLGIWLSRTKSRAQEMTSEIDQMGKNATVFNVINTTGAQLIKTNENLAVAQKDLNTELKHGTFLAPAMAARFGPLGSGAQEAADRVTALTGKQSQLIGTLHLVSGRLAAVAGAYGTDGLAGAMGLAAVAGVKIDQLLSGDKKVWAGALQQIDGVVQGYANMGVGATGLGNAINVLTIAQSDQLKNMQSLNSAFDEFTKIVSGPVSGFLTFANTLKRFSNDAGAAGASISGLGTGMKGVSKKVTDASLQLQSDFQDTFNSATQMADAMRLTGVASDKQVSAIKDVVQVMIPMAGSNKAAAAEISALAQEAGGPATTNLKTLAKWAGKTSDPLGKAQKAAADAAVSFFDMSKDAQKLGTTLSQDLTKDMSQAVQNAVGLQGAMDAFAKSVHNGTQATAAGHKARKTLYEDLAAVNITGPQADSIIKAITSQLDINGRTAQATHKARKSINDDIQTIMNRGPVAKKDLMDMTKAIIDHGIGSDKEKSARQKLIDDLHATGLKSKDATDLVEGLIRKLQKVPKKVATDIEVHAGGSGTVHVFAGGLGAGGQGNVRFTSGAARGMYVAEGTTPTADDVLARVSKGELVVPTHMVAAGEVDHLRGRIPGFKSGGFAGLDAGIASGPRKVAGLEVKFAGQMLAAWAKKAIAAAKAAMGGDGGSIVSYARSLLGKIPYVWGGTSLSGADCSGFTGLVYRHAGYRNIPRTSEAQGAWVDATPQPQAGGLAFYHSPAGGPDPGHVAIIDNGGNRIISQGGGMGPKLEGLHALPLLWTGVPPGGFKGGNIGRPGNGGRYTWTQLEQLWTKAGGRAGAAASMASIAIAESGGDPNAHNPSGATGLWQILGNPFPGNAFDPLTNARMAVAKYNASGFYPWISDPVAARLIAHGITRAKGGLIPGHASGGTVSGLRSRLAAEQAGERLKYSGLVRSFAAGPAKDRTKTVIGELSTLAARQKSEQAAYAALSGAGLTTTAMHHLGATARAEIRTASDQGLNKKHPGFARDLRMYLGQISATASGTVPAVGTTGGGKTGGTTGGRTSTGDVSLAGVNIPKQGAAYLRAWQTRHGGGFGAAWGPIPVNPQIDAMNTAIHRATVLSKAQGLTAKQHKHYTALAADEKKRLATLKKELAVERAWRSQLGSSDDTLLSDIHAAGNTPSLAKNVRAWRSQISRQKATIGKISMMLGLSAAQVAAAEKAGKLGPGGKPLPKITHTFGGDVGNVIAPILAAALVPLGAARGGLVMDRGGWLQPGWNPPIFNGTGRPERVTPPGGGGISITFEVDSSGNAFDRFMTGWLSKNVKVKGAGDVQTAFGQPNIRFVRR